MATLSIEVTTEQAQRVIAALRAKYPKNTNLSDTELAKKCIEDTLRHEVYEYEYKNARAQVAVPSWK